jgi:hypothetical protein
VPSKDLPEIDEGSRSLSKPSQLGEHAERAAHVGSSEVSNDDEDVMQVCLKHQSIIFCNQNAEYEIVYNIPDGENMEILLDIEHLVAVF